MSIEEKLKAKILEEFGTMKDFVDVTGLKYTTVDSIFKRGLMNSNVQNIIKICNTLKIDANELAEGRITPVKSGDSAVELRDVISFDEHIVIDGKKLTDFEKRMLLYYIGMIKLQREEKDEA